MDKSASRKTEEAMLIKSAREGDSLAFALLMHRYSHLLHSYIGTLAVSESEKEDLAQEGLIGLLKAVRSYDDKQAEFSTYAVVCMKRSIITALRKYNRSASALVSELPTEESDTAEGESPETGFLDSESGRILYNRLFRVLSPLEKQVFELYLSDMSYAYMAKALGRDVKSVDNAVQRIRAKLRRMI